MAPFSSSYGTSIATLSPRDVFAGSNAPHQTCRVYASISDSISAGSGDSFVFELAEPTHVEYVQAIGQGKDDDRGLDGAAYLEYDTCGDLTYGNRYWHGAKVFVGNSTTASGNEYCGYAGSEILHEANTDLGYDLDPYELFRMGGSVACPSDIGSSKYVVIQMA